MLTLPYPRTSPVWPGPSQPSRRFTGRLAGRLGQPRDPVRPGPDPAAAAVTPGPDRPKLSAIEVITKSRPSNQLRVMPHLDELYVDQQSARATEGQYLEAGPAPDYQSLGYRYQTVIWQGNQAGFQSLRHHYGANSTHPTVVVTNPQGQRFNLLHLTSQYYPGSLLLSADPLRPHQQHYAVPHSPRGPLPEPGQLESQPAPEVSPRGTPQPPRLVTKTSPGHPAQCRAQLDSLGPTLRWMQTKWIPYPAGTDPARRRTPRTPSLQLPG